MVDEYRYEESMLFPSVKFEEYFNKFGDWSLKEWQKEGRSKSEARDHFARYSGQILIDESPWFVPGSRQAVATVSGPSTAIAAAIRLAAHWPNAYSSSWWTEAR